MGYFLIYENMLTTVLVARDRWLVPSLVPRSVEDCGCAAYLD